MTDISHPRRPRGRPAFEATEQQRRQVLLLMAEGNTEAVIAAVLDTSVSTLKRHFGAELARGRLLGSARNTKRLHEQAARGNVAAIIWLDKTRYGITEAVARAHGYSGPMARLPRDEAAAIYRRLYWLRPRFDQVAERAPRVAAELFDTGANMGPAVAATSRHDVDVGRSPIARQPR